MRVKVIGSWDKAPNEIGNDIGVQLAAPLISIDNQLGDAHLLQLDEAAQRGKDVVANSDLATYLKPLNIAYLLEQAMILHDLPVLIAQELEAVRPESGISFFARLAHRVMAPLFLCRFESAIVRLPQFPRD